MGLTKRTAADVPALSPELRTLFIEGPWAIGQTTANLSPARHDELVGLWQVHGPAILSSLPKRKKAWFVDRIKWVEFCRSLGR